MKKYLRIFMAMAVVLVMCQSAFAVVYGQTDYEKQGYSESTAWEINSAAVLAKVRDDTNNGKLNFKAYYKLTNDIDLTGSAYRDWRGIGGTHDSIYAVPVNPFVGVFDGNGHTIKVNISRLGGGGKLYTSLFGYVYGGVIKNLSVEGNIEIYMRDTIQTIYAGGIAAYLREGTIENCKFDGTVSAVNQADSAPGAYAGGIVAYAGYSYHIFAIKNCSVGARLYTNVTASCSSFADWEYAGGLVGYLDDNNYNSQYSEVSGNYSRADVNGGNSGGIYAARGRNEGIFENNTEANPNDPITITTASLPSGKIDENYSAVLVCDCVGAVWSITNGNLPAGLELDGVSGKISGTPTTSGTYTFTAEASFGKVSSSKQFTLTIAAAAQPTYSLAIITSSLPDGKVGTSYNSSLKAEAFGMDVSASSQWSVSSGSLPSGLSLNASTGAITGTPSTAGTYTFTVTVTWGTLSPSSKTFTITIAADSGSDPNATPEIGVVIPPSFEIATLILEGQIGVNFYANLPYIDGVSYTPGNCWTDFNVRGDTSPVPQPYDETFKRNEKAGTYYGFRCYINAAQMADPITATLHYGNNQTVTLNYSATQYLNAALKMSSFPQTVYDLMAAIKNYGHYVQPMLSIQNGWDIGDKYLLIEAHSELTDQDINSARDGTKDFALVYKPSGSGISGGFTYSLLLGSETTLNLDVTPASGYSGNVYAYVDGGTANMAVKNGSKYRIQISNIAAKELGDMHSVKIIMDAESSVQISALSYANYVLNTNMSQIGKVDIETMKKAVTALYQYYEAAKAYFANK